VSGVILIGEKRNFIIEKTNFWEYNNKDSSKIIFCRREKYGKLLL
jgi:hypothetical protein